MSRKWLRLDAQWDDTEWVAMLGPLGQLAWIKLLCYAKRDGAGGRVYAMSPRVAGKRWDLPPKAIEEMLEAAIHDGALAVEEGKWVIAKWKTYQEHDRTAAERMRKMRARHDAEVTGSYGALRSVTP